MCWHLGSGSGLGLEGELEWCGEGWPLCSGSEKVKENGFLSVYSGLLRH